MVDRMPELLYCVVLTMGVCGAAASYVMRLHAGFSRMLRKVREAVCQPGCSLFGRNGIWPQGAKEDLLDEARLQAHIWTEVDARRAMYAKRMVIAIGFVFSVRAAMICVNIVLQRPRWMDPMQDVLFAFVLFFLYFIDCQPWLLRGRYLNFLHCFFSIALFVFCVPTTRIDVVERNHVYVSLARLFLGFINLQIRVSIWTNLAFSLGMLIWIRGQSQLMQIECLVMLAQVMLLFAMEANMVSNIKHATRIRSMQGQRSAVTSLLRMVCDVVVELDKDLQIVGDCPALSNILFHGSGKHLQSLRFQEFIIGDDRTLFEERLAPALNLAPSAAAASMFHVRLRDSWGNAVSVELFHVPFQGAGDERRHLVGLREFADVSDDLRSRLPAISRPLRASAGICGLTSSSSAATSSRSTADLGAFGSASAASPPAGGTVAAAKEGVVGSAAAASPRAGGAEAAAREGAGGGQGENSFSTASSGRPPVDTAGFGSDFENAWREAAGAHAATDVLPVALGRPQSPGCSSASPDSSTSNEGGDQSVLQVDVFALHPLPVHYVSRGFYRKYGSPERFTELLPDPAEFSSWLVRLADEVWDGTRRPQVESFGEVVVRHGDLSCSRRVFVNFKDPRAKIDGRVLQDRSAYKVSIRLGGMRSSISGSGASSSSSTTGSKCSRGGPRAGIGLGTSALSERFALRGPPLQRVQL